MSNSDRERAGESERRMRVENRGRGRGKEQCQPSTKTSKAAPAEAIRGLITGKTVKEKTMARRKLVSMGIMKGGTPFLPRLGTIAYHAFGD